MILVTGGEGYLGGRIVDYLSSRGFQIRVGGREEKKGVVKIDFTSQESLEEACNGVEYVIHLAAMNASDCENSPEKALLINGLGTLKLINAAIKEKVSKFIYFSTSHVYANSTAGIVNEKTLARPANHYSITHKLAEDYLMSEIDRGTISGTILRLTNAVGPPKNKESNCWMLFVNNICKQIVTTKKIKIYSDLSIKKDFIPISSICLSTLFVIKENLNGEIFNISSGEMRTLGDIAIFIQERSCLTLNFTPEIISNKNFCNSKGVIKTISNEKSRLFGFNIESNITNEVDRLLLDCYKWFKL